MSAPKREILWTPGTNARQADFLAAGEDEVLYGGAAGGGKSDGIIIDALGLQQNAIDYKSYQAIIFRRTFKELSDLIDRSKEIYNQNIPGARYTSSPNHVWTFPSGAKIEFGHINHPQERFKYRGRQFAYIGWDELTLFPDAVCYLYLKSRLRSPQTRLACYVRATTNPDGPGHKWVKEYWAIPNDGSSTCFQVEVKDEETGKSYKRWRRFIRATLDDNPYLSETEYRVTLLGLPPEERDALLRGRWDGIPVKGAFWAEQIGKMRREGRICTVPYVEGLPVDTYWDLGRSDSTAIVFHQSVALQDRFPLAYENSGQALSHYARYLKETGFVFGTHYVPHDADHVRLGQTEQSTKSWKAMLEDLLPGHAFETIPRVQDVMLGINQTRIHAFANTYMDSEGCKDLIAALENHRREWDDKLQVFRDKPLEDWSVHYSDAFRQFGQRRANLIGDSDHGGYTRRGSTQRGRRNPLNV